MFGPRRSVWRLVAVFILFCLLMGMVGFGQTERTSLLATLALGLSSAAISVVLGSLLACGLYRGGARMELCLPLLLLALLLPVYWQLAAWDSLFGRLGLWSAFSETPLRLQLPQWLAAIWVHSISGVAPAAAILFLFLVNTGKVVEEQALVEASPRAVFWNVTLPRLWPAILFAGGWCFLTATREIAVTDIYRIGTVAEQVYLGFALGQFDQLISLWPEGEQALSLRLYVYTVVLLAAVAGCWLAAIPNWTWSGEYRNWRSQEIAGRSRGWFSTVLLLSLILLVPIASLIFRAGVRVRNIDGHPQAAWSLADLIESLLRAFRESQAEFLWSLTIAATSASLLLFFGLGAAAVAQRSRAGNWLFFLSLAIALGMPGPICGALVAKAWSLLEFQWAYWMADRTILLPVLASVLFCWPLAGLAVWLALRTTPRELLEAASSQGLSGLSAFWSIQVLANWRWLAGIWLLLAVWVLGDLSAQQMVAAPGIDTIPRQLLGWMHAGVDELAAGTSLLLAALLSLLACVAGRLWIRR